MATQPIPAPPDIQQQQVGGGDQQSLTSKFGQIQTESQAAGVRAFKAMMDEIGKIADSTKKIAEMADKIMPSLMGDISKLIEVGKSMQAAVKQAAQQAQQGASTSPEQPPATSPTDAAPAITA